MLSTRSAFAGHMSSKLAAQSSSPQAFISDPAYSRRDHVQPTQPPAGVSTRSAAQHALITDYSGTAWSDY